MGVLQAAIQSRCPRFRAPGFTDSGLSFQHMSNGSRYYDLVVTLGSGKEIFLFGGCVFEGRMNREKMEDLRERIEQSIGMQEKMQTKM